MCYVAVTCNRKSNLVLKWLQRLYAKFSASKTIVFWIKKKMAHKTIEVYCGTNSLGLNLCASMLLALSSQLSVLLNHQYPFAFFVMSKSCRSLRNVFLGGPRIPFPGLIKRSHHGWLRMMKSHQRSPFSDLPWPLTPSSLLLTNDKVWRSYVGDSVDFGAQR